MFERLYMTFMFFGLPPLLGAGIGAGLGLLLDSIISLVSGDPLFFLFTVLAGLAGLLCGTIWSVIIFQAMRQGLKK